MNLQPKTLEKLRLLINEETEYRSGPKLIEFFKYRRDIKYNYKNFLNYLVLMIHMVRDFLPDGYIQMKN